MCLCWGGGLEGAGVIPGFGYARKKLIGSKGDLKNNFA